MEAAVKSLEKDEQDILLKFIYKGFSEPSDSSCGSLLAWHEKVIIVILIDFEIERTFEKYIIVVQVKF